MMNDPDKRHFPLITVGIPTYNGRSRLEKALSSLWRQQYPNLEVIISDNCSTDDTRQLIESVQRDHPNVRYYRQDVNIGLIANFDFALRQATGTYFMWLADDDTIAPGALMKYCSFLNENPSYALVSGQINYVKNGHIVYRERNFTIENASPGVRTIQYYFRVIYGGMFHGLMRRDIASAIPPRFVFGNDLHFVASLAFLGKIKNLPWSGYDKNFGGFSRDTRQCALRLGESELASRFVRVKIAADAYREVMQSAIYSRLSPFAKILLAMSCCVAAFACYYGRVYPFIIGGKLKRLFVNKANQGRGKEEIPVTS